MEFKEVQKFKQWLLWLIICATAFPFSYVLYLVLATDTVFNTELKLVLAASGGICLAVVSTFFFLRLETTYSSTGITYRFYPVHLKPKIILWESVTHWEVKTYNPLREYGGWGLRYGRGGKAFNVSGDKGILLHLKTGRTLLFGTQKPEELKGVLAALNIPNMVNIQK